MTTAGQKPRTLAAVFCYNEGLKIKATLEAFPSPCLYDVVVMNDGSTDDSEKYIVSLGFKMLKHMENRGAGAAIRTVYDYALENGYEVLALIAGNGKMRPAEIERLLEPVYADRADYVQGSRYLPGGKSENLPLFRRAMIHLFTWTAYLLTGFKGTDVTCGFRAYRLSLLRDPHVDYRQKWLTKYEMEYYIHYKAIVLGYRICEVPVSMIYPAERRNYSKIRPFSGWWSMIRPWIYLKLGLKK